MKRYLLILSVILGVALLFVDVGARPAKGAFGITDLQVAFRNKDGSLATQAGSHPFSLTVSFGIAHTGEGPKAIADGKIRDAIFQQIPGLVGDANALPVCSSADFLFNPPRCSLQTVVGMQSASVSNTDFFFPPEPIFSLAPPPGSVVRLGWKVEGVPIVIDVSIKNSAEYNAIASTRGINQTVAVFASVVELWGVPGDPAHDTVRGKCANAAEVVERSRIVMLESSLSCPTGSSPVPFLTLPRSCSGPVTTRYEVRSWQEPENWVTGAFTDPVGFSGCSTLGFAPSITSQATAESAETGTGLDFSIDFDDEGLTNPVESARAQSDIEKAVITLPEGMTVNPSVGEGLGVCTPTNLQGETLSGAPGEGCPNASKIGTVNVQTPLLDDTVNGSVFLAQQDDPTTRAKGAENPFDSLIAFYIVLKDARNGILVKQPAKVEPDPRTGRLVTTVEDIPQLPFSHFNFHFREGQRAPLITPPACGTFTTQAQFTPRAEPTRVRPVQADFQIDHGIGGGPCPANGIPPFHPGFEAGSLNNNAASFSPFILRLTRADGEQDMTKFSSILPPGVVGKLAGVGKCPDAQIALAKSKTGRQELASPSCPTASRIGGSLAGAGVGSALTYVPGQLYLAGPYKGAPLSVVSVTPAIAGPFDAGTVVVRIALRVNPLTAEVEADGKASDPIPHILKGIPLKVREIRVAVDRDDFILNPTSCDPSQARATLFGGFLDVFSPLDDVPVSLSSRYQAANCETLRFRPKLRLRLSGGTHRGDHPSLRGVFLPRAGDANLASLILRLPRSAFLDQAHIRTICTRVQFAEDACPPAAIYGHAKAITPLLDEPLVGPVYLRSSNHNLPDFVADLHGLVDVEAVARIDSARGGLRSSFETVPDAPISKVIVNLPGGRKGLIVNSRNLCPAKARADAELTAHNGKLHISKPLVHARGCSKARKGQRRPARNR